MLNRRIQIIHSYVPIGLLVWLLFWFIPYYDQTERIILFAVFVVVPLTLYRVIESAKQKPLFLLKLLVSQIPIGAMALAVSFLLSPGIVAGLLSIPWGFVTVWIAVTGAFLFIKRSANFAEVSKGIGFLYISIGGIWVVAHQFGVPLLGFQGHIMLLTVNHFHYAGFVAPVLFGFLHDSPWKSSLSRIMVVLGGIAPILIALGITYSPLLNGCLLSFSPCHSSCTASLSFFRSFQKPPVGQRDYIFSQAVSFGLRWHWRSLTGLGNGRGSQPSRFPP